MSEEQNFAGTAPSAPPAEFVPSFESSAAPVMLEPGHLGESPDPAPRPPRKPTAALGWMALGIAVLFAIADVVAVTLAVQRSWETATLIAQASNLGTVVAFVAGLFALARKPGRSWGIAAMVLAVLANPFILTHLLAFLSGS